MLNLLRRWSVLICFGILVTSGIFRVWTYQSNLQMGYALSQKESELRKQSDLVRQLEIELAAELSPQSLKRMAKRLNLAPPQPSQIMTTKQTQLAHNVGER